MPSKYLLLLFIAGGVTLLPLLTGVNGERGDEFSSKSYLQRYLNVESDISARVSSPQPLLLAVGFRGVMKPILFGLIFSF